MRPRLLVLTPDYPPVLGGIQLLAHRVVRNMRQVRPGVVTVGGKLAPGFDAEEPVVVHRSPSASDQRLEMALLNAWALVWGLRMRPDLILSLHIVTGLASSALRRLLGVPVALYVYADEVRGRPRLAAFSLARADAVIVVSRHTRDLAVAAGAKPDHVHIVHPGVDPRGTIAAERSAVPTVLTVARLADRYKGHDVMVRALPLVRERVPDARWVVVGDGPLRAELEAAVREHGVEHAVEFTGAVTDPERDAWFERAHVFAMPSRLPEGGGGGEGFGIVFLEAGARGLPVVAGGVGGALDAVLDGQTGLLVDPTDPSAVAGALAELLRDPARAERLGLAGVEHARRHSWAAVSERVEAILLPLTAVG